MQRLHQENPERLLRLYYIAFVIMIGIFVLSYAGISYLQSESANAETLINIAGRQRMLSQRISFLSMLLVDSDNAPTTQNLQQAFDDTLNEWQAVHHALLFGNETLQIKAIQNPVIQQSITDLTPLLNQLAQTTQCLIGQLASNVCNTNSISSLEETLIQQQDAYLVAMDNIVLQMEQTYRARRTNTQTLGFILVLEELIGFGVIGVVLLRPSLMQLANTLAEVIAVRKELESEVRIKQALFEQSPVAMTLGFELDKPIQANQAFCNFLGYTQHEIQSMCPCPILLVS